MGENRPRVQQQDWRRIISARHPIGIKDYLISERIGSINFATKDFPPSYITGGNADPLTAGNSKPFAAKLQSLGVDVTTLFWPEDYTPALPHEYQFRLNLDAAQQSLTESLAFVAAHTVRP